MASKVTNLGERLVLDTAMEHAPALYVRLARADFEVSDDQDVSDFIEADFQGYIPIRIVYIALDADNPGGRAIAIFEPIQFNCSGSVHPNLIYGYWIEDASHNVFIVERFTGSPRPMQSAGQSVSIELQVRLWSPT